MIKIGPLSVTSLVKNQSSHRSIRNYKQIFFSQYVFILSFQICLIFDSTFPFLTQKRTIIAVLSGLVMKNRNINLISIGDAAIIPAGRQSKIKEPSVTFKFRLGLQKNFFSFFKNVLNHTKFFEPLKVEG